MALAAAELKVLACRHHVAFEYEGSVMSGTPVIRMAKTMPAGAGLTGFEGILNGTSNFVLGRMEARLGFSAAVTEAQALGYAEADPTADFGGHDVRLKVVILPKELLGGALNRPGVRQPLVGYARAATLARRALVEGVGLREVVEKDGSFSREQIEAIFGGPIARGSITARR